MRAWQIAILASVAMLAAAACCPADTVILNSGLKIQGKVTSPAGADVVVVETSDGVKKLRKSMVDRVEIAAPASQPQKGPPPVGPADPPKAAPSDSVKPPKEPTIPDRPGMGGTDRPAIGRPAVVERPAPTPAQTPAVNAPQAWTPRTFAEAQVRAGRSATAPDGLAVWQEFQKTPAAAAGGLDEQIKKQLETWKQRSDADTVPWDKQWVARKTVRDRLDKADELVAKAAAAAEPKEAMALLDQAAQSHPYRPDILFRKGAIHLRDGKLQLFNTTMSQVVKIDEGHPAAWNNLGVLCAQNKLWTQAVSNLAKAMDNTAGEAPLDNLDLVMDMARQDKIPALALAGWDRLIRKQVDRSHAAGLHVGENRWGSEWVAEADCQKFIKDNAELDRQIEPLAAKMADLQNRYDKAKALYDRCMAIVRVRPSNPDPSYGQRSEDAYEQSRAANSEMSNLDSAKSTLGTEIQSLQSKRRAQTHAARLVLLDADCASDLSQPAVSAPDPAPDKPAIPITPTTPTTPGKRRPRTPAVVP